MPAHDTFLRMIIENPDDDGPRLVYADWLEEQGEAERAEFIRVQCELARLPAASPDRCRLAARQEGILEACRSEWFGAVPDHFLRVHRIDGEVFWDGFCRGFLENLSCTAQEFVRHAAMLERFASKFQFTLANYHAADAVSGQDDRSEE